MKWPYGKKNSENKILAASIVAACVLISQAAAGEFGGFEIVVEPGEADTAGFAPWDGTYTQDPAPASVYTEDPAPAGYEDIPLSPEYEENTAQDIHSDFSSNTEAGPAADEYPYADWYGQSGMDEEIHDYGSYAAAEPFSEPVDRKSVV